MANNFKPLFGHLSKFDQKITIFRSHRINIFSNLNFSKIMYENSKLYQITIQSKRLNNVNVIFAAKFIDVEKGKKWLCNTNK